MIRVPGLFIVPVTTTSPCCAKSCDTVPEIGARIKLSPAYYEDTRLTCGRQLPTGESLHWDKEAAYAKEPLPPKLVKALGMVVDNKREVGPLRQWIKGARTMTAKDTFKL